MEETTMKRLYFDDQGRTYIDEDEKKPLIALPGELREVALWLIRALTLIGAVVQLRVSLLGH